MNEGTLRPIKVVAPAGIPVAATFIVNETDVNPNRDGSFSMKVMLDEGENYISIVAYDDVGNSSEREIIMTRTIDGL